MMRKQSFLRSVLTVSSGTVIAQFISIVCSPIISRLYTPDAIGGLANFTAITTVLSVIASGCYDNAIVLPKSKKEANTIVYVCIFLTIILGFVFTFICIIFKRHLLRVLNFKNISVFWFYLLGMNVAIIGIDAVLSKYAIRNKHYKIIAQTQVTQQIGSNGIKVFFGFFSFGVDGLFIGTIFSQIARVIRLFLGERKEFFSKRFKPSMYGFCYVLKRYKRFPLLTSWSVLLNSASVQLPIVVITTLFSTETAGAYAMSNRILSLPMALIGSSVSNVFLQKASVIRNDMKALQLLTNEIYKKLLSFGAICMSIVCFWGDVLFPLVLGKNWVTAGVFSQRLSFWVLFVLATSPLSQIYIILERQGENLFVNVCLFVFRTGSIIICFYFNYDSLTMISIYSFISALLWFLQCGRILTLLKIPLYKFLLETCMILFSVYGVQFGIWYLLKCLRG